MSYDIDNGAPLRRPYIAPELLIRAAKEFGRKHGFRGNGGGWISRELPNGQRRNVCQGWFNFGSLYFREIADHYTAELTAIDTFQGLLNTSPNYNPTILPRTWRETFLADAFDRAQFDRKSPRRAWRGSGVS